MTFDVIGGIIGTKRGLAVRGKINAAVTAFSMLAICLLPMVRSGGLHQFWKWIEQADLTAAGLRELALTLVMGVQFLPAFWFGCIWGAGWRDYLINMLLLAALAVLSSLARKMIERKRTEV